MLLMLWVSLFRDPENTAALAGAAVLLNSVKRGNALGDSQE